VIKIIAPIHRERKSSAAETPRIRWRTTDAAMPVSIAAAKRAAVEAYCRGWISFEMLVEMFLRNPEWRTA